MNYWAGMGDLRLWENVQNLSIYFFGNFFYTCYINKNNLI